MIPEVGHFARGVALAVAVLQTALPFAGVRSGNAAALRFARPAARTRAGLVLVACLSLSYVFAVNDFSVRYVANHSNSLLPLQYKLPAVREVHVLERTDKPLGVPSR